MIFPFVTRKKIFDDFFNRFFMKKINNHIKSFRNDLDHNDDYGTSRSPYCQI